MKPKLLFVCNLVVLLVMIGCHTPLGDSGETPEQSSTTVTLAHLTPTAANEVLTTLELGPVSLASEPNTIILGGASSVQQKATLVLSLMDGEQRYVVESLGPASVVRSLPSNGQIARAVGDITLGTFADPPVADAAMPGLLDVLGERVVLIVPFGYEQKVRQAIALGRALLEAPSPPLPSQPSQVVTQVAEPSAPPHVATAVVPSAEPEPSIPEEGRDVLDTNALPQRDPNTIRGVLKPLADLRSDTATPQVVTPLNLPNGEDVLELTLPEQMDLIELLDLAGEYLDLDYVYDEAKVRNQSITLRLHGKREGKLRVKDLYTLLETALKFKGLVMVRKEGNLVSVVPVSEALDVDPTLVSPEEGTVYPGDMVVTRIFELQYVDVTSVTNLLQAMKLGVVVSPVPETQTLFVTCYAHRMARIEQLVQKVDRPGRSKEFRFRRLQFTSARTLAAKVQTLATELQDIAVSITTTASSSKPGPPVPVRPKGAGEAGMSTPAVFLDTDERTNRLLMIGAAPQLDLVEQLIDTLDVGQQDLRTLRAYTVKHLEAQVAAEKLQMLGVLEAVTPQRSPSAKGPAPTAPEEELPEDQAQVIVIEATNSLLINATWEQHQRVQGLLKYVDVTRSDRRSLRVYPIEKVDAQEVLQKLDELEITAGRKGLSSRPAKGVSSSGKVTMVPAGDVPTNTEILQEPPQVVVLESTNALLVNATNDQHEQIATIIRLVDVERPKESIPYEIYFLENQAPDHLAEILGKIVQETVVNDEGKITSNKPRDPDDQIVIVPDELTFSLIVYANRKNQEWIGVLIEQLDRQQAQVLIDVTLVEISKTDEFNLDLNLISGIPDMLATSGLMDPVSGTVTSTDIIDRLQTSGRHRFIDLQAKSGAGNAFYGDDQVMLLVKAMDEKKYGRVLAKPKVLVNDNETGTITTKDTTYVKSTKQSTLPGNSEAIITSEEFTPYDAGITLEIKPHINDSDFLRLNIVMTRSDFIAAGGEAPPDQSSSDLNTVVTVPDGSTIILGGMLKLNQTKGSTKVPGLGDLPLLGGLFRGSSRSNVQKRLYIFVKAEIIRPAEALAEKEWDLKRISDENRAAFEAMEKRFQDYQLWPGVMDKNTDPCQVLEAR